MARRQGSVLMVDRHPRGEVEHWLDRAGLQVERRTDRHRAIRDLEHLVPHAVLLDSSVDDRSGLCTLQQVRQRRPGVPVILLTSDPSIEKVVEAMQAGAHAYLPRPVDRNALIDAVTKAIGRRPSAAPRLGMHGLLGQSPPMERMYQQLERVARSEVTVLIQGESGTGKELVARAVHDQSARAGAPFVAINCAAIPESLQESELFGHEKGSFTGAADRRVGRFEQAHTGTLFLDEVGELTPALQAKLLRVLQERCFYRVGGTLERRVDVRIVAATHQDLGEAVRQGRFREDLFYRLAVFELLVPPLRDRGDDVLLLARHFLDELSQRHRGEHLELSDETEAVIGQYTWPGNVRELRNAMERAVVVATGPRIRVEDLPRRVLTPTEPPPTTLPEPEPMPGLSPMERLERQAIEACLQSARGNVSEVIRTLGIPRTSMYRKLHRYGLRS